MKKSPTRNQKQSSGSFEDVFWCHISSWNFSQKHDIYNLIYMTVNMEKTFKAMQCQKCRKYFMKKWESLNICKKTIVFFGSWLEFQYFRHLLKNPNLLLMAGFPNNHFLYYTFPNPWALIQIYQQQHKKRNNIKKKTFVIWHLPPVTSHLSPVTCHLTNALCTFAMKFPGGWVTRLREV